MADDPDNSLDWSAPGGPRSPRFGDVYYSLEDGLAESRAVFLAGCGLPDAWSKRRRFTVAELGFGTGLNIAALLHLWRESRTGGRLNIFSIEGFPVTREDAARALSAWPGIAEAARALLDRWPPGTPGFHRIDLPDWNATLDLAVGDAAYYKIIQSVLVAHLHGNAAQISVEIGRGDVPTTAQPSFTELEEALSEAGTAV